jgi:hypothetical protein
MVGSMTLEQTMSFLIFSLVAALTPGPSNVMITATGSAAGIARELPCALGGNCWHGITVVCRIGCDDPVVENVFTPTYHRQAPPASLAPTRSSFW